MRAKLIVLFVILVVCALAMSYDLWPDRQQPTITQVAAPAAHFATVPDFTFSTIDQKSHMIKSLPEQGIILHFWASWCGPCLIELPHLVKRVADSHGRLALVAVSIDDNFDAMNQFIARQHQKDTSHVYWVWDQDKYISLKLFNTTTPPETILINARRQMVDKIVGDPDWTLPEAKRLLDKL